MRATNDAIEAHEQRERARYRAALHEAGHAVVALATGHRIASVYVGPGHGVCVHADRYRSATAAAAILRAGEASEWLHTGHGSFEGAAGDRAILAAITTDPATAEAGWRNANLILTANAGAVLRLADRLMVSCSMTGAEVTALVGTLSQWSL